MTEKYKNMINSLVFQVIFLKDSLTEKKYLLKIFTDRLQRSAAFSHECWTPKNL